MADTVKQVRIYQNNTVTGEYDIEAATVNAANVKLTNSKTLKDVLIKADGSVRDLSSVHVDGVYLINDADEAATFNLADDGIAIWTGYDTNGDKTIVPLNKVIGIAGISDTTDSSSMTNKTVGLAPLSHASARSDTYGAATSALYGHVKLINDIADIPTSGSTDGLALGVDIVSSIASGTEISFANYLSNVNYISDNGIYYTYTDEDIIKGLIAIKQRYMKTSRNKTNWLKYYNGTKTTEYDYGIAYYFVEHWCGSGSYASKVVSSSGEFHNRRKLNSSETASDILLYPDMPA